MGIIALMGRAKSGKDTIGEMTTEARPRHVVRMAFANKLKETCMDVFGLSREDVYTEQGKDTPTRHVCLHCPVCRSMACRLEGNWATCDGCGNRMSPPDMFRSSWTPRMILQHIATEMRRVDNDVFVNFTMREAARWLSKDVQLTASSAVTKAASIVVITDCRFRVEADAVWRAGGQVWRIHRPLTDGQQQGIAGHVSETEMDTIPDALFQRVIVNDGTLDDLRAKVLAALAA